MKKSELKKVLKPIVKECIQEALLEEGLLSNVISEVVKGLGAAQQPIVEQKQNKDQIKKMQIEEKKKRTQKMNDTRKKMLDVIGKDSYNGIDLFEGTTPTRSAGTPGATTAPSSPLSDVEPGDPGVDISSLMGNANVWKALSKG